MNATATLTVGDIRKAIQKPPGDAPVRLDIAVRSGDDDLEQAMVDIVPGRAFRDSLHGALVIDGQLDA